MESGEVEENKNENIAQEEFSDNSYDLSEEKLNKYVPQKSKKIQCGSSTLHILPVKLNDENKCQRKPVDEYFEKYIKKNDEEKSDNYDCTLFRGRLLNGKKVNIENKDNFKINFIELIKEDDDDNSYKISINRKVNDYYVWKYDALIEKDNNLMNLENNMKKLDILS